MITKVEFILHFTLKKKKKRKPEGKKFQLSITIALIRRKQIIRKQN
jgi:hypothetical protein